MKAGYSRLKVTPGLGDVINGYHHPRYSDGILDDLYVTAVAFSDGERTGVAITMDILEMTRPDCNKLRAMIAESCGIDADAVILHCIHSHTTPEISGVMFEKNEAYVDFFFKRVRDAAAFAIADLKEASFFVATGEAKGVSFIRRFIMKDGSSKMYPKKDDPDVVRPDGEPDETVQLVKITREGGHDIAIVNFQTHPDTIGGNKFSADFVHFVRLTLEQALADEADGKGCKVAYFNGAQGDTAFYNIDNPRRGYTHVRHMGRVIAAGVLSVYTYAEPVETEKLLFKQVDVHIPDSDDDNVRVSCLGIGDVAFLGLPGEPYTELGRRIKKGSAFKMTIPTCNTNDWMSYIPTKEAFLYGGYGVHPGFNIETADILVDRAIELTKEVKN